MPLPVVMTSRRPFAIALAASAFYAGMFVTAAQAEMHYVRVTLVTGQQLTITVEVPPGTPVDQLQIPGLPAADRLDRGPRLDGEHADADGDDGADGHRPADADRDRDGRRPATPKSGSTTSGRRARRRTRPTSRADETEEKVEDEANKAGGDANTESLTGKVEEADADADARATRTTRPQPPAAERPDVLARRARRGQDRRPELLHRQVPDPAVPAADLPGRRHAVRHPLGAAGRDQRDRDRLRPQRQRHLAPARRAGCSSCPRRGRPTASTATRTA